VSNEIGLAQARRILVTLQRDLQKITERDPEQEVRGLAIPAVDAAISAVRNAIPDNAVVARIEDVISPEAIDTGEPIRAVDVLLVVTILLAAMPARRDPGPQVWSPDIPRPFGQ